MRIYRVTVLPQIFIVSLWLGTILLVEAEKTELLPIENGNDGNGLSVSDDDEGDETITTKEPFIATDKWQPIKPGQSIPAGLHVRLNLHTGLKEAKLMDPKEETKHNNPSTAQSGKKRRYSPEELKEALKAIKTEEILGMNKKQEGTHLPKVNTKFRNIEELKRDLESLNLNIKPESEIVLDILKDYGKSKDENKVVGLQDLEFLVHKFDTAQDFVKLGGLDVIVPDLNSTNPKIRSLVAFTLGSAMQGNPKVQIAVLEHNVLSHLLRLVTLDTEFSVRNRVLYAISCMVRQFPFAQLRLIENGGVTALISILRERTNPDSHKLQLKVLTLFHDLLNEKELAKQHFSKDNDDDEAQIEKLRQYESINLEESLVSNGACELVTKLLPSSDIDTQEKVIAAMSIMIGHCREQFKKDIPKLRQLAQMFRTKAAEESEESDEPYYSALYSSVNGLMREMRHYQKEEL